MVAELLDHGRVVRSVASLDIEVNTVEYALSGVRFGYYERAYPSRTAAPKGRVLLEPPRKMFQIVSAKADACESDVKLGFEPPPPRLISTILPLAWQASMCEARN